MCARCDLAPPAGTAASAPCARCGTPLVGADPFSDPFSDPFTSPASLDLVGLDERADAPALPAPRTVEPPAAPATGFPMSVADFAPQDHIALEVDPAWTAGRVAKQAVARQPPPRPPRRIAGVVVALLLIAGVTAGVVVIMQRAPAMQSATITVKVTGRRGTEVLVDGRLTGSLPLSLELPRSTRTVLVTAGGVTRQIVPDHDQTVDLAR